MSNLIPVSRKEQYLSKIDGMTNKSPDKTYTKEEYFFSEILGEALHKPVLETRYEMYLAKIAGREIGIPYPETRLERFLAKAAGMNISVPTPITREEMYWSTYSPFYLSNASGEPPLSYNSVTGTLNNYRIYGQTVDGESVGDRTGNLWNGVLIDGVYTDNTLNNVGLATGVFKSLSVYLNAGTYTLSFSTNVNVVRYIEKDVLYTENLAINVSSYTFTLSNATSIGFSFRDATSSTTQWDNNINVMLNAGSSPLPYEPYGYKVPVTVEGKNLFDYDTITHGYRIQWSTGANYADETAIMSDFISVSENSTYATDTNLYWLCYDANKQYIGAWDGSDIVKSGVDAINSMTAISPCKFIRILSFGSKITPISSTTMLNCGSTALPYEPYHAPITTPIYLPEQIRKVGDEAEYIEYGTQKMYRIGADDLDVTLPALPTVTGTNVLSVGTEVQPSHIFAEFDKEREYG